MAKKERHLIRDGFFFFCEVFRYRAGRGEASESVDAQTNTAIRNTEKYATGNAYRLETAWLSLYNHTKGIFRRGKKKEEKV